MATNAAEITDSPDNHVSTSHCGSIYRAERSDDTWYVHDVENDDVIIFSLPFGALRSPIHRADMLHEFVDVYRDGFDLGLKRGEKFGRAEERRLVRDVMHDVLGIDKIVGAIAAAAEGTSSWER